jgi:hypothetical protein
MILYYQNIVVEIIPQMTPGGSGEYLNTISIQN